MVKKATNMSAAPWAEDHRVLHLARRTNRCTVLGPGVRAVLWVQGCPFRCPGCIAPETLLFQGGECVDVASLADELSGIPDIEGVTFSGGEPLAQPVPLVNLIDSIKRKRDLSFMCYTGYTLEFLRRHDTPAQKALIERLDILIDGPYLRARHTNLRWRGSDNQRVHFLSPRYRGLAAQANERGYKVECEMTADGKIHIMGILPDRFREAYERGMRDRGVLLAFEGQS